MVGLLPRRPSLSLQHKDPISVASVAGAPPPPVSLRVPACPALPCPLTPHGRWALGPRLPEGASGPSHTLVEACEGDRNLLDLNASQNG